MFWNNNRFVKQLVFILLALFLFFHCSTDNSNGISFSADQNNDSKGESTIERLVNKKFKVKPIDSYDDKYDAYFRKATKKFFGIDTDYRWFKSQAMAESGLDHEAVSPVGAKGIMQVMDPTYAEIKRKNNDILGNVFSARWNIQAGIYYDSYLYGQWSSPRPEFDRMAFMFASYNAGLGNILKAQKICGKYDIGDCNLWNDVKIYGVEVNTWKQKETIHYVTKIFKFMGNKNY